MPEISPLVRIRSGTPIKIESVECDTVEHLVEVRTMRMAYPADRYRGEYVFTPNTETQIVPIAGKIAERNITINPIPPDWGHITWDGSVLTVS